MKNNQYNLKQMALVMAALMLSFNSCKEKDEDDSKPGQGVRVSGNITQNTTWRAQDTIYLNGYVYVKEGATLTIEPGTLIKGISDTKAALIIERGARIMAEGTRQKPIVFTSDKPAGERQPGDWAGIIICGKAPINQTGGQAEMEGGTGAMYGGNDPNDNSGVLKFVRIEFAGYEVSNGNEINGLSMGGVGRGTTIQYVQVSFGRDDAFEWWGGTVDAKYLVSYRTGDDDFDTDNGFSGRIQFGLIIRGPQEADKTDASNGFESDNDKDGTSNEPYTSATFSNITILGPYATPAQTDVNPNHQNGLRLRRNTRINLHNSIIAGFKFGLRLEGPSATLYNQADGPALKNNIMAGCLTNFRLNDVLSADQFAQMWLDGNNIILNNNNDVLPASAWNWGNINALPTAGSIALSGANFTGLDMTFFEAVTFRGAFGTTDWTQGWCNWDPQNTQY